MSREIGIAGKLIGSHSVPYCDLLTVDTGYVSP